MTFGTSFGYLPADQSQLQILGTHALRLTMQEPSQTVRTLAPAVSTEAATWTSNGTPSLHAATSATLCTKTRTTSTNATIFVTVRFSHSRIQLDLKIRSITTKCIAFILSSRWFMFDFDYGTIKIQGFMALCIPVRNL